MSLTATSQGCPFDCGICPQHHKNACTAVLELTDRCNLQCPVCFADSGGLVGVDMSLAAVKEQFQLVLQTYGSDILIQLSGGEPTVRDDLPAIIELGCSFGFPFLQLNTNGIRLSEEAGYAAALRQAGLASVFLQFDGTEDSIYRKLRGRSLYREKRCAIEQCAVNGLGVVLVPTLVPGVNMDNIGAILQLALELSPVVRGVHFQPISYLGRCLAPPDNRERLTIPDVLRAIEEQTAGLLRVEDFTPPGWEHSLCSFHGTFLPKPGGGLQSLTGHVGGGCCAPADVGGHAVSFTARQWSAPVQDAPGTKSPAMLSGGDGLETIDSFLERVRTRMLSISGMAFQDVWNLDLERARNCCIHVVAPGNRLIPFCLYNMTSAAGKRLYRER
jgi:7,8-dihydro-6-hydroxymethylpterin dimethyltransferase